jgi:hypothetical protein
MLYGKRGEPATAHPRRLLPCWVCGRHHRSWYAYATCRWRKALWVAGNPPGRFCWALVSRCHPGCTVTLHATLEGAIASRHAIDVGACGGCCQGETGHRILPLHEEFDG